MRRPAMVCRAVGFTLLTVLASIRCVTADDLPRRPVLGAAVVANPSGVRVTAVSPGSPAESAGLRPDDVITSFAVQPVSTPADFVAAVRATPVAQPKPVEILRAGAAQTLLVTLISAPKESDPNVDTIYSSITVDGTLRRTLTTLPRGAQGKLPAVLIVGGIGCFTVDNPNDPYDAYRYLAHDLARSGIVAMRLEKSGVGDSQGAPCFDTDYNAESRSYKVALQVLQSGSHVDPKRIFLFGHSIGTLISPRLALEIPVAGIIFSEGVGRNWFEYELWNLRRQAELAGDTPTEVDATLQTKEVCMHRLLIERQNESDIERDTPDCKDYVPYPVTNVYMQQVAALNVAEPWAHIAVPVLAIYGTGDFVTAEADHRRIVSMVNANHPGSAALHTIEGMDHHLGAAGSPQAAWDLRMKDHKQSPYEPGLSAEVCSWICAQTHCG